MTVKKLIKELQKIEKKHGNVTVTVDLAAHANRVNDDYDYEKVQWLNVLADVSMVDEDGIPEKRTRTLVVINEGLGL